MRLKALLKKNLVKDNKIIADHLIPQVSSVKTPKEIFDSLTKLFEGKNINQKMTLRNQLKNVKIQNEKTISYFTRVFRMTSQVHGIHSFKECVPKGSD